MRALPVSLLATTLLACHSSSSTDSTETCAQLLSEAQSPVEQASTNVSCTTSADCAIASNTSACFNACGVVVNEAGVAALEAAISDVNTTTCAQYIADGCKVNSPPPCAPLIGAYCVAGQCTEGPPSDEDAGPVTGDASTD